jgi:hypothetical protein
LERAGRRYRVVSTSAGIASHHALVLAGSAVMVSTLPKLCAGLRPCDPAEGLPELPETSVLLLKAREPRQPVTDLLGAHIVSAYRAYAQESVA